MSKGAIACDFDKTLAFHVDGQEKLGNPIPKMLRRIKRHLADGEDVEIFSARASNAKAISEIQNWCEENGLPRLPVTNVKKHYFSIMYDDRARQVIPNKGEVVVQTRARRRLSLSR